MSPYFTERLAKEHRDDLLRGRSVALRPLRRDQGEEPTVVEPSASIRPLRRDQGEEPTVVEPSASILVRSTL